MKLRSRATVSLSAVSDVVILVPPGKGADSHDELERSLGTTENTLLHGTVTLNLPKSRIVKEILVELVGLNRFGHVPSVVVFSIANRCIHDLHRSRGRA